MWVGTSNTSYIRISALLQIVRQYLIVCASGRTKVPKGNQNIGQSPDFQPQLTAQPGVDKEAIKITIKSSSSCLVFITRHKFSVHISQVCLKFAICMLQH